MKKIGIIGGSGVYNFSDIVLLAEIDCDTPFGRPSDKILHFKLNDSEFYFIPRHGRGHKITPSEINYRANIFALKQLGIDTVVSISAVGSLKEDHHPGKFVLPSQFIDWTKGLRDRTFFDRGMVGHVSAADPIDKTLQKRISDCLSKTSIDYSAGGSYVCIEGPQFSTRAESNIYRSFEADVIGMTNVPEAFLAKEAGMAYATIAMITDYDCWMDEHCTVEEIMKVMGKNYVSVQELIKIMVPDLVQNPIKVEKENQFAVITNQDLLTSKHREILDVILK